MKQRIIGILGGMGPNASGYLYNLMNSLAVKEYGAKENSDFPETILYSVPVPDFISSNKNRGKALTMLTSRVKNLNMLPISVMGIACNTAHILLPELQKKSDAQFISMVEEVTQEVLKKDLKKVGLLATSSTIKSKLYKNALREKGMLIILPSKKDQESLDAIIKAAVGEKIEQKQTEMLFAIANTLKIKGAEAIILACTELPLLFPKKFSLPVFNSVEILARALLKETMI